MHYEYSAIESLYIFKSLPFFAIVYCIWIGLLLLLVFTLKIKNKGDWEGLALSLIFSLVCLGFWTFIAPIRSSDGLNNAISVQYISTQGQLSANITYGEFPGLLLLTSVLQQVTGLNVLAATGTFVIFNALFLAVVFYLLMLKFLRNQRFAAIGVILFFQGNWVLSRMNWFYPGYMGLTLIIIFLILLNRREGSILNTFGDMLMAIIISVAATITHFISSEILPFVIIGIIIIQIANRRKAGSNEITYPDDAHGISWSILFLSLIIPIIWVLYYASTTFGFLIGYVPTFIHALTQDQLFTYALIVGQSNLGGTVPLWANATRWFWLVFIYVFGFILALWKLFKVRRLNSVERKIVGGLIGITLFCGVSFLISPGGEQGQRFLMYLPLCLVPIILGFFINLGWHIRKYIFGTLAILLFISGLPSFLAYNNTVSTDAFYPQDFSTGRFVESAYGDINNLKVFSEGTDTSIATNYEVPNANYYLGASNFTLLKNVNAVWQALDELLSTYENSQGQRIFIFSIRTEVPYEHTFGIKPTDPNWQIILETLQDGNEVYNNNSVQIYQPATQ